MAATGVLPFIRGVDLSGNDFKVRIFSNILGIYVHNCLVTSIVRELSKVNPSLETRNNKLLKATTLA